MSTHAIFSRYEAMLAGAECGTENLGEYEISWIAVHGCCAQDLGNTENVIICFHSLGNIRPVFEPWLRMNGIAFKTF